MYVTYNPKNDKEGDNTKRDEDSKYTDRDTTMPHVQQFDDDQTSNNIHIGSICNVSIIIILFIHKAWFRLLLNFI